MTDATDKYWIGRIVRVFVDGRHDFTRQAKVLAVDDDQLLVRWIGHIGSDEWIPGSWI